MMVGFDRAHGLPECQLRLGNALNPFRPRNALHSSISARFRLIMSGREAVLQSSIEMPHEHRAAM